MSIKYSLYDLYTFLIPGIIYLYTINEFLALFNLPYFELTKLTNLAYIILSLVAAYILGHAFYALRYLVWMRQRKDNIPQEALELFKSWYPEINIEFNVDDGGELLYSIIKMRDVPSVAFQPIQIARVYHQMLMNLTQGFILLGILQIAEIISKGFMIDHFVIGIFVFLLSWILNTYSWSWYKYYFSALFSAALVYGNSLEKVLSNDQLKWKESDIQNVFRIKEEIKK